MRTSSCSLRSDVMAPLPATQGLPRYLLAGEPAAAARGLQEIAVERALRWIRPGQATLALVGDGATRALTHEELRALQALECGVGG